MVWAIPTLSVRASTPHLNHRRFHVTVHNNSFDSAPVQQLQEFGVRDTHITDQAGSRQDSPCEVNDVK